MTTDTHMSSPPLPPRSDDELFGIGKPVTSHFETIETVPISRIADSPEHDTLVSLPTIPIDNGFQTQRMGLSLSQSQSQFGRPVPNTSAGQHMTQPTQLIDRSPSDISSPPSRPTVQVAASSPMATPAPAVRRPTGILASAMAPAGTAFRRPILPIQRPIEIPSDDEEVARSSDSDTIEKRRSDIKTSTFVRQGTADKTNHSPNNGLDKFKDLARGYGYKATEYAAGTKRPSDVMANAYGNVSKRPKQTIPSRAIPVGVSRPEGGDMELDDIEDVNERNKVRRMRSTLTTTSIRDLYNALKLKKGNYDDAADYILLQSEKKAKENRVIPISDSEDELLMTPAANKTKQTSAVADARQQAKKPTKSIHEKWTSTQPTARKPSIQHKKLDVFDDPGPAPAKGRKLIRGRKQRSPSPGTTSERKDKAAPIEVSDDSDVPPANESDREDTTFESRILDFFNNCTALDLQDTSGIAKDLAVHFVAKRPYKSLDAVANVQNPNLKPSKSRRKPEPIGVRVLDKVTEMMQSYEAVDYLVKECEKIAAPLAAEMKQWGVDIYGSSGAGELDMTNLNAGSQRSGSSHDSGIGTPISDDDHDGINKGTARRGFITQPPSMAEGIKMKDYQVVGLNWLSLLYRKKKSCILADDMGLGKTLQTIAFIAHLAETGVRGPHLIVVPAATLENWLKEFNRFCPGLDVVPYYAPNPTERALMREDIDERSDEINVIITTYTIAKAKEDYPWLKAFGFSCTIFDEGHQLKNADSKVTRTLMRIRSEFRLLLTGTPLQNNLKELISLLNFLMPDLFSSRRDQLEVIFKQDIKTISEDDTSREMLLSKKRIERARSMLTPFILRRKKWQVLKDLPKKERKVEYCDMTPQQLDIYHGWLARAYEIREKRANGERIPLDETANILMKLRQAAIHPLLFRRIYTDGSLTKIAKACLKDPLWAMSNPDLIFEELTHYSDFEVHQLCAKSKPLQKYMLRSEDLSSSGKIQAMIRLLNRFISEGQRILIFSQFVMVLDILEVVLSQQQVKFYRLDGNTKVSERQDLIDEFNEDLPPATDPDYEQKKADQVPVFMLSTKAGGAGINLASASRVIIFDSGFNPQDDVQAENRAHRIGQKREVEVWRLVTKSSVEEQIFGMGEVKLRLDKEVAGEATEELEGGDKDENTKEEEGRGLVEDLFFKNLNETPRPAKTTDATKARNATPPERKPFAADNRFEGEDVLSDTDRPDLTAAEAADEKIKAELAAELSSPDTSEAEPESMRVESPVVAPKASQKSSRASSRSKPAATKRKDSTDLPTRLKGKATRPKVGSRVNSGNGKDAGPSQRSIRSYVK